MFKEWASVWALDAYIYVCSYGCASWCENGAGSATLAAPVSATTWISSSWIQTTLRLVVYQCSLSTDATKKLIDKSNNIPSGFWCRENCSIELWILLGFADFPKELEELQFELEELEKQEQRVHLGSFHSTGKIDRTSTHFSSRNCCKQCFQWFIERTEMVGTLKPHWKAA